VTSLKLSAFFGFPWVVAIGLDPYEFHASKGVYGDHIKRKAMIDEASQRLAPVRGGGRRFLVQDRLQGVLVQKSYSFCRRVPLEIARGLVVAFFCELSAKPSLKALA
jgi:hypothetical protein